MIYTDTIASRIIEVCDVCTNGNMSTFARELGVTPAYISKLKNAPNRVPGSRTISDICRVFGVNEKWLRSGEGKMFLPRPRGEEIGDIVKAAARHDPEEAAKFFRALLEDMSDAEIVLMYEILRRHFPQK